MEKDEVDGAVVPPAAEAPVTEWIRDSKNPYNWPMWKRVYHAVVPAVFGLVV